MMRFGARVVLPILGKELWLKWVASRVRVWGREALGPVLVAGGRY